MSLPLISGRGWRGGSFAAGPAAPVADTGISDADILAMSPIIWLDADAEYVEEGSGDPVETDGDNVTSWLDRSGNDRDFLGYSAGYYPHWYEAGTNDLPYVHFDADRLRWTSDDTYATPMTIYHVISHDTVAQTSKYLWHAASSTYNTRHNSEADGAGHRPSFGTDGEPAYWGIQSTDTRIIQLFASGSDAKLRVNGGADEGQDWLPSTAQAENLITTSQSFYLGFGLAFKLYEWILIPDVTHDQDVVFSYLGDKYDISVTAVS